MSKVTNPGDNGRESAHRDPAGPWEQHLGTGVVGTREDEILLHFISTPATCVRQLWVIWDPVEASVDI